MTHHKPQPITIASTDGRPTPHPDGSLYGF